MLLKINLENILFLDIETVPEHENYTALSQEMQDLWDTKSKYQRKDEFTPEEFYSNAGIWAEFGKINLYFSRLFRFKKWKKKV